MSCFFFVVDIKVSDPNFILGDKRLFVDVLCFLTFNFSAMMGSLVTSWIQWVRFLSNSRKSKISILKMFVRLFFFQPKKEYLVWPVILRVLLIPLFLTCNYLPLDIERIMPIYIKNDWIYWAIGISMGFSSGYLRYAIDKSYRNCLNCRYFYMQIVSFHAY